MKRRWKQGKGKHQREAMPDSKEKKKLEEKFESLKGGRGSSKFQNKKKFQDKIKIECSNCENYGHFTSDCWFGKGKQKTGTEEANMVQDDSDSNPIMLIITTSKEAPTSDMWYLYFCCSNHMT